MNTCYRIELTSIKCQVPLDTLENIALLAAKFFSPPKFLGFPRSHRAFYAPCTPSLLSIIPFSSQVCLVCYVSSLASCVSRVMWLNMSCSLSYGPCTLHIFNRYWYLNQWFSRCSAFSSSLHIDIVHLSESFKLTEFLFLAIRINFSELASVSMVFLLLISFWSWSGIDINYSNDVKHTILNPAWSCAIIYL